MKLLAFLLPFGVLAYDEYARLARAIGARSPDTEFAGYVAEHTNGLYALSDADIAGLADVAVEAHKTCFETARWLAKNGLFADAFLRQLTGVKRTIYDDGAVACDERFPDRVGPCESVVQAAKQYCDAALCGRYKDNLRQDRALSFGTCATFFDNDATYPLSIPQRRFGLD